MGITFIWYFLCFFLASEHPFYVSITDMKYHAENNSLEIEQRIFWDDLENELNEIYSKKVNILNPESREELDRLLTSYLLKVNEVYINDKKVHLAYLGYETDADAAWFYLEGKNVEMPRKVRIVNTLLLSTLPSQRNIINFYLHKKPRSLITKKGAESGEISF